MTLKLYETDSHLTSCEAEVVSCEKNGALFDVRFDQTVFFPEAGGQPSDAGTAGAAHIVAVREEAGEIIHSADAPLAPGTRVPLQIDWARRFDFMQQHTGEHLLSFACFKLFCAHNVGFHLAETDYTTIDFDRPLEPAQLKSAQRLVNDCIWRDLPVTAKTYESEAALAGVPLRKHAEGLIPPIRVVSIEDADCCTCCAPHCRRTGEIGSLLITDSMAYKGGTRVFFVCGGRALAHAEAMHDTADAIARRFSCSRDKALAAVEKLRGECAAARRAEKELGARLCAYECEKMRAAADVLPGGARLIVGLLSQSDAPRLKALAQGALDPAQPSLCVLLARDNGKLAYCAACTDGFLPDAGEIIAAVNAAAGGKGGGRGAFAQGMAPSDAGAAETAEQLRAYLHRRLSERK